MWPNPYLENWILQVTGVYLGSRGFTLFVALNNSVAYSSFVYAQYLAFKISAWRELQKEKHLEEISDSTACMETLYGLDSDSEKAVDCVMSTVSLSVRHS